MHTYTERERDGKIDNLKDFFDPYISHGLNYFNSPTEVRLSLQSNECTIVSFSLPNIRTLTFRHLQKSDCQCSYLRVIMIV